MHVHEDNAVSWPPGIVRLVLETWLEVDVAFQSMNGKLVLPWRGSALRCNPNACLQDPAVLLC